MRTIFFAILFSFTMMSAFSQDATTSQIPVDEGTGLITYKEVINEEGTKNELYNRAAMWLNKFYANPWEVAKVRDQATGLIKIEHQFPIYDYDDQGNKKDAGMVLYDAKLEFKDGRYRIVVDNFVWKQLSRYPAEKWLDEKAPDYNAKWKGYLQQIDSFVNNEMIPSLKESMKPEKVIKEEDW